MPKRTVFSDLFFSFSYDLKIGELGRTFGRTF